MLYIKAIWHFLALKIPHFITKIPHFITKIPHFITKLALLNKNC